MHAFIIARYCGRLHIQALLRLSLPTKHGEHILITTHLHVSIILVTRHAQILINLGYELARHDRYQLTYLGDLAFSFR